MWGFNSANFEEERNMRSAKALAAVVVMAAGTAAIASESVTINLAGVQFRNATPQSRTSAPQTLDPACRYTYTIDGLVRGQSGLLATLFPTDTPLAQVLETLAPGSSAGLSGIAENPTKTHPIEVLNQTTSGSQVVGIFTITYSLDLVAGVNASNNAFFELRNVTLSPSALVGSLVFSSGTATVTRAFCPADLNQDCVTDFTDFLAFFNCFDQNQACADIDGSTEVDFSDFLAFFNGFDTGC
jgi:hypothetical protein